METYYGTKIVDAYPDKNALEEEGYAIIYEDNYRSWSPKEVFERAYQSIKNMSFGHAILAMKSNRKVARAGWNKNTFLFYVEPTNYPASVNSVGAMIDVYPYVMVPYQDYIAMFTKEGEVVPWTPSQTDILANDWRILQY